MNSNGRTLPTEATIQTFARPFAMPVQDTNSTNDGPQASATPLSSDSTLSSPFLSPSSDNLARRVRAQLLKARHRIRDRDPFQVPGYLSPPVAPSVWPSAKDVCRSQICRVGKCTRAHKPGQHFPLNPRDRASMSAGLTQPGPAYDGSWEVKTSSRHATQTRQQEDQDGNEHPRRRDINGTGIHVFVSSRYESERRRMGEEAPRRPADRLTPPVARNTPSDIMPLDLALTLEARHKAVRDLEDPFVDRPAPVIIPGVRPKTRPPPLFDSFDS